MHIESVAVPRSQALQSGRDELPDVLMLVRASTLKVIRLQLAMERNDRRVALEAVDDLVALDRRLQDCLTAMTGGGDQPLFPSDLDHERALLNHEKLTLAAEVLLRPKLIPEPETEPEQSEWIEAVEGVAAEEPRRRRWLLAIPILASAAAAAIYVTGFPHLEQWLAAGGLG